jgi:hypothetical protein
MDYPKLFYKIKQRMAKDARVILLLSSQDPGLCDYYNWLGVNGSTDMGEDGTICVKIHDAGGAGRSTWYEEMGHVGQFLRDGNVPLGTESPEVARREVEVAHCLINSKRNRKLSDDEIKLCHKSLEIYSNRL